MGTFIALKLAQYVIDHQLDQVVYKHIFFCSRPQIQYLVKIHSFRDVLHQARVERRQVKLAIVNNLHEVFVERPLGHVVRNLAQLQELGRNHDAQTVVGRYFFSDQLLSLPLLRLQVPNAEIKRLQVASQRDLNALLRFNSVDDLLEVGDVRFRPLAVQVNYLGLLVFRLFDYDFDFVEVKGGRFP